MLRKNMITKIFSYSFILLILSLAFASTDYTAFVKGQSSGNEGNASTLKQKSNKLFLPIEDLVVSKTSIGQVEITGNVKNNYTSNIHNIKINGEFLDKSGSVLGKVDKFVTQPSFILKPGEKHGFYDLIVISHYKLASTNITATGEPIN